MDWKLFVLICFVFIIVAYLELSYFNVNGRRISFLSKLVLALMFPVLLIIGFILGSIFLFVIIGIVLVVLLIGLIFYLIKLFSRKTEKIILIKRKK